MTDHSESVVRIAREIMRHAEGLWHGAEGDAAAEGAAFGAMAAAIVAHGERHSLALDLALFAQRTMAGGLAYIEDVARQDEETALDAGYFDHDWYD